MNDDRDRRRGRNDPDVTRRDLMASVPAAGVAAGGAGIAGASETSSRGASLDAEYGVDVEPGESASVDVDVTVGDKQPVSTVDVLFCFDLTGSMSDEVDAVKRRAKEIVRDLRAKDFDPAFGVAGFMDYPARYDSYGYADRYGSESDYPWKVHRSMTTDADAVKTTMQSIELGQGADGPECYTRALYECQTDEDIGWRDGALRLVVVFGDAIPHDDDFHTIADEWGSYPNRSTGGDPGPDGEMFTADDLDFQRVVGSMDIPVLWVNSGVYDAHAKYAAEKTGGRYFKLEQADELPQTVVTLVEETSSSVTLTLSAGPRYDPWISTDPSAFDDVGAGESRTFSLAVGPPDDAPLGTHLFEVKALANGSAFKSIPVAASVTGETSRHPPAADYSGAGPELASRLAFYRWFESSLRRSYWLAGGDEKLANFADRWSENLQSKLSTIDEVASESGVEAYAEASESFSALASASGSVATWGAGTLQAVARARVEERSDVPDVTPVKRVRRIARLLAPERDDADPEREAARKELGELIEYLGAWIVELQRISAEGEDVEWAFDAATGSADLTDSDAASITLTADGATPQWISLVPSIEGAGWTAGGSFAVDASVEGASDRGHSAAFEDSYVFGTSGPASSPASEMRVEEDESVVLDVEASERPEAVFPWASVESVSVEARLGYDMRRDEELLSADVRDRVDRLASNVAASGRLQAQRTGVDQLRAALAFFSGERALLAPDAMAGAAVYSPVDLGVRADGHLGPVYDDDGEMTRIETSLSADYAYTGPDAEPEGVALVGTDGDFDLDIRGRENGTYSVDLFVGSTGSDGPSVEVVESKEKVPISPGKTHTVPLEVSTEDGDASIEADLTDVRRALKSGPLDGVPVLGVLGGAGLLGLVGAAAYLRRRSGSDAEGATPPAGGDGPDPREVADRRQRGQQGQRADGTQRGGRRLDRDAGRGNRGPQPDRRGQRPRDGSRRGEHDREPNGERRRSGDDDRRGDRGPPEGDRSRRSGAEDPRRDDRSREAGVDETGPTCPSCGADNAPGSEYCIHCGTGLGESE